MPANNSKFAAQPTREAVRSLKNLGLNREQRRMLLDGKAVNWQNPHSTLNTYEFFIYKVENGTFNASILSIQNKNAPGALQRFVSKSEETARRLGCNHLKIDGISVELRLSKVMQERYGFEAGKQILVKTTNRYEPALSRTFDLSKKVELELRSGIKNQNTLKYK